MKFNYRLRKTLADYLFYLPPFLKGRYSKIFPDDSFVVSYPKSGNTWLLFMLSSVMNGGKAMDFQSIHGFIPDIYFFSNANLKRRSRPRILKSHEYLQPDYPRVLHLIRDPRSVAVSYFFYMKKLNRIDEETPFEKYLDWYLNGDLDRYGSWEKHAGGWRGAYMENENYLEIRYEDLKSDTQQNLSKICSFLNINSNAEIIESAITNSSISEMKNAESSSLKVGKKDIPFVREGKASAWKEHFDQNSHQKLVDRFGKVMEAFGYTTQSS